MERARLKPTTTKISKTQEAHTSAPQKTPALTFAQHILHLQRTVGNRAVGRLLMQAKLAVSHPEEPYEREADRVAEQVTSMPSPASTPTAQRQMMPEEDKDTQLLQTKPLAASMTPLGQRQAMPKEENKAELPVQKKPLAEGITPLAWRQMIPEEEQEEEKPVHPQPLLQRSAGEESVDAGHGIEQQLGQSSGKGSPLPASVRSYMEPRFGTDFSGVRVHTGSESQHLNRSLNAQAFTVGQEIYYGASKSPTDLSLTAHELTHVVQQTGGGTTQRKLARGLSTQHSVAPGVQLAPLSRNDLYKRKVEIAEKLKQPNLPADEALRLQTELAGIEKSLTGAEHDPNDYQGAGFILTGATQMLHIDNMNGRWTPWDLPPVPPAYTGMYYDFYKARAGIDWVGGKQVDIRGTARRTRLEEGLRTAQPLIKRLEKGGAASWLQNNFWKFYRYVEQETYVDEARQLVEQNVAGSGAAQAAKQVPKIVPKDEQLLGYAITGRETIDRLLQLVTRFGSAQMENELAKVFASLDKGATMQNAFKGVDAMKFTQAAYHVRGVLNTIAAVLTITDLADREKAAKRHPNIFSSVTDLMWQTERVLEGAVVFTSAFTATVARLSGFADDAARALMMGSRVLRVASTIGATLQALYGFSVLFDPDATAEQRRGALFDIGLGVAGAGSLPALWGGARLWAGGPWTIAVLWGALVYQYQRALTAGMKQGWLTYAVRYAFESLQLRAERVSDSAKPLAIALFHLKYLSQGGPQPEASLQAGMATVVRTETGNVRDQLERLVDLTTKRSDWFLEREPGDFAAFKRRFLPIRDELARAKKPDEILALALSSLDIIRTAFQESDQIFVEELTKSLSR